MRTAFGAKLNFRRPFIRTGQRRAAGWLPYEALARPLDFVNLRNPRLTLSASCAPELKEMKNGCIYYGTHYHKIIQDMSQFQHNYLEPCRR